MLGDADGGGGGGGAVAGFVDGGDGDLDGGAGGEAGGGVLAVGGGRVYWIAAGDLFEDAVAVGAEGVVPVVFWAEPRWVLVVPRFWLRWLRGARVALRSAMRRVQAAILDLTDRWL